MPKPDLSIIIVSYNTKKLTKECIDSIIKSLSSSQINYEIVVIDNNSTDGSAEMLKNFEEKFNDRFTLIAKKENLGFGKGNNLGVKHAKSEYILLLNTDILVLNNAIEKLFKFYRQNEEETHFLGGKLLNSDMSEQPSACRFFSLPIVFAVLFLRGDYWGLTRSSPNKTRRVDWISGACILTKKKYFDKLEGFDKEIFMYMEEVDLLYRAKKLGYKTYFFPEAKFIHYGSGSSGKRTFPILQVYKGFLYLYDKHYSRMAVLILRIMLKLKARIAVLIGKMTKNRYLIETYEKAYRLAKAKFDLVKVDR